ncbi:hypothetical protein [Legionella spiritensis]|uniref:hypothetical protein n=1 Tax=Legionella spiritensis TaxID=452 RepID=UPI000F6F0558|nr:hypothetical protein [Legionella spiritensis]VEG89779.1 Uncharacterised protein [Legionella spiritensis]
MKKTFDKLDKLKLEQLDNPNYLPKIQNFLQQLKSDFEQYVAPGEFDPIKQADNWLEVVRNLANNKHPAINKDSLKKIEKINDLLGGKGEDAFRLLDMYQSIDTVNSDQEASKTKK